MELVSLVIFVNRKTLKFTFLKKNDNDLIHQTVVYYNNLFVAGIYGRYESTAPHCQMLNERAFILYFHVNPNLTEEIVFFSSKVVIY